MPERLSGAALSPTPIIDAELIEDDREPPQFCPAHMSDGTGTSCRECKTARINHDRWTQRHPSTAVLNGQPISTTDLRIRKVQALKTKFHNPPQEPDQ